MRTKGYVLMLLTLLIMSGLFAGNAFALGLGSNVGQDTPGQALVFGYYDTRSLADGGPGLTDNYFVVTNTLDTYTQAHVRVRTGEKSIELIDFDLMMTPFDVFGFELYQINGQIVFASCDTHTLQQSGFALNLDINGDGLNECYIITSDATAPAGFYFPNLTSLIKECTGVSEEDAVKATLKGYVEVLGEGDFVLGPPPCDVVPPGTTLWDWTQIPCGVTNWYPPHLMGKTYYANLGPNWPSAIEALGDLNAYAFQWFVDGAVILHKDTYTEELASPTGPGYAYDRASATPDGANDINMCFYNDGPAVAPYVNRVGAAATFGPTLADIDYDLGTADIGRMDRGFPVDYRATVAQVDSLTSDIFQGVRDGTDWCMIGGTVDLCYSNGTRTTMAHFFNYPPALKSSFVFTFPTMHFIGQQVQVRELLAFNTEETDCIIPPGKFISPGLPGAPTFAQEVSITTPETCPAFVEGWREYELNVVSDEVGSVPAFFDYYNDAAPDDRVVLVTGYSPLAITFEMTAGNGAFSSSPMTKDPTTATPIYWTDN